MAVIEKLEKQRDKFRFLNNRVWQRGNLIVSEDYEEHIERNIYSTSKCFTSLAVGIAEIKGMLPLNDKICNILREEIPINAGKFLKHISVKYFLPMGLEEHIPYLMGSQSICRIETGDIK